MNPLNLAISIVGLFVFMFIAWLCSTNRKNVDYKHVLITFAVAVGLAAFFTLVPAGQAAVDAAANGFTWIVNYAYKGIAFGLPDFVLKEYGGTSTSQSMMFIVSSLLPFLLIIPIFDTLTYFGVMPFIIKWVGRGISFVSGRPRFEAFFSVEMMFLGNTEAMIVSRLQTLMLTPERALTIILMSMSCISASIVGAYISMVPGQYVLAAIPINILNAIIISSILNPVAVPDDEDFIVNPNGTIEYFAKDKSKVAHLPQRVELGDDVELDEKGNPKKPAFFSFLSDSILTAGRLVLIIFASVVAFVSLVYFINGLLGLFGQSWLSLENIFGCIFYPFSALMGVDFSHIFDVAQQMGTKLVTNEFVVMGNFNTITAGWDARTIAILTTYITSFANFSTVGMLLGTAKSVFSKEAVAYCSKQVPRMLIAGQLVSLMSATMVGLFVW